MPLHPPPALVGRDAEIATLTDALGAVGRGAGQLVVLRGEAGIGKLNLAAHVRGTGDRYGAMVLVGRAVAGPAAVPLRR